MESKKLGAKRYLKDRDAKQVEHVKAKKARKLETNGKAKNGGKAPSNGAPLAEKTRASKPDFKPYYTEHRKIMEKHGLKTEDMVALRRQIHSQAEGGFQEFKT